MKVRVYRDGVCHDFDPNEGDIILLDVTKIDQELIQNMDPACRVYAMGPTKVDTDTFRTLSKAYRRDLDDKDKEDRKL